MPPTWLVAASWAALAVAFASAGVIAWDVYGRGYRQHMRIMEIVWPVTGRGRQVLSLGTPAELTAAYGDAVTVTGHRTDRHRTPAGTFQPFTRITARPSGPPGGAVARRRGRGRVRSRR